MLVSLLACLGGSEKPQPGEPGDSAEVTDTDSPVDDTGSTSSGSAGCGATPSLATGNLIVDAGAAGDGQRGAFLMVPSDYDPEVPHALVVGYPGTNWVGEQIRPYLDLERHATQPTVFVYPDPLWRDFPVWGTYGGWVLGPNAYPADGEQDLVFTRALLDVLEADLCIDTDKVWATGHSWGGDMAAVVACFLGDRFTASVPVAANRPYWFEPSPSCTGATAVWTLFGENDTHFTMQDYPGQFGDEQDLWWFGENACTGSAELSVGQASCSEHTGCAVETRYCLYEPSAGHGRPDWYAQETMRWLESLTF